MIRVVSTTRSFRLVAERGRGSGAVGLVGMHVAHKTQSCASWVWSTFEHVDALECTDSLTGSVRRPLFRDPLSQCAAQSDSPPDAHVLDAPVSPSFPLRRSLADVGRRLSDAARVECVVPGCEWLLVDGPALWCLRAGANGEFEVFEAPGRR